MPYDDPHPRRESVLTLFLTIAAATMAVWFFMLITAPWLTMLPLIVGGMVAFVALHYVLWGRRLEQETAGEREEEELRRRAEMREDTAE